MTTELQVRDHFVMLGGLRFHYREWGGPGVDERAPALVLLHGATSTARSWGRFAAAMADRFRVFALDWRGHGESAWSDDYTHPRMEEDLHAFLEHLVLRDVAVVGLSMGGSIGYLYAARHPGMVERLVIGDVGPDGVTILRAQPQVVAAIRASAEVRFPDPEAAIAQARAANPRRAVEDVREQIVAALVRRADGGWGWRYDGACPGGWFDSLPGEGELWALLAQVTCPTLVVRGAESDLLSRATAERMAATLPHGQWVEVPASGHGVPYDNPAGFVAAVRPFLLGESR